MHISTVFKRQFNSFIFILLTSSSFGLLGSPEEPEQIKFNDRIYEIVSIIVPINGGELICHSPLETNKSIFMKHNPRLFCNSEFSQCLHRPNGYLCNWAVINNKLVLISIDSYLYRFDNSNIINRKLYSKLFASRLTPEEIKKLHPGNFEKVTAHNYRIINWNTRGVAEARWFSGIIKIEYPGQTPIPLEFKKGKLIQSPDRPNPALNPDAASASHRPLRSFQISRPQPPRRFGSAG